MNLTPSSISTEPLPDGWVKKMFRLMLLEYGKRFTDQWGMVDTAEMTRHWAHELAGYSGVEIKHGLQALETRDWPPTLSEFKKMCRAPVDPLVAYYQAVEGVRARVAGRMGVWSHPAIYAAAMPLAHELLSLTYSQIKLRWEAALAGQMALGQWQPIPPPPLAIGNDAKSENASERAAKMIEELGAVGITRTMHAKAQPDEKRWARRILERAKAGGDKYLTISVLESAKAALLAPE